MKFCPRCIEFDVNDPSLIDDDEGICGYCFDTIQEIAEQERVEELVA